MATKKVRVRGHIQAIHHERIKMFKPQTSRVLEVHCARHVEIGERRATRKSSRYGGPSMTKAAHAFSQNVILFGRPARQPPLCQGI
ncbi:unnamed protein product [Clonostachys rosea]|uniref:Uncharacterized protein n=1 Tax=Bionectria ochroleuca TaxID=29856 RepID=A0ABY6UF71_BIOOC|nr:unnamed protein product [Clonostachys rosea]